MSESRSGAPKFTELNELAAHANGGKILFATDDWFATAENMLSDTDPIFIPGKFTEFGKWMDGWETRRKRIPGHDWCIIKLGAKCKLRGLTVDTGFFTGNFSPKISIQGALLSEFEEEQFPQRTSKIGSACTEQEAAEVAKLKTEQWTTIVPMLPLKAGYEETRYNYIQIDSNKVCSHIRLNIYPDGGIARFRVFGEVQPNFEQLQGTKLVDLIALENGGSCISYSNAHYGHPRNLIRPNRAINMGDGWETLRRLDRPEILENDDAGNLNVPGEEWAVIKMCCLGTVESIVVDTLHFRGNFPDRVRIEGAKLNDRETLALVQWTEMLPNQKLSAHKEHYYKEEIQNAGPFNVLRVTIAPDGGVSRLRVFGKMDEISNGSNNV